MSCDQSIYILMFAIIQYAEPEFIHAQSSFKDHYSHISEQYQTFELCDL